MKIDAKITICRTTSNQGPPTITIEIQDEASRASFFRGSMSMEDYAHAISGLSCMPIAANVVALDKVGKQRVSENRSVLCPLKDYDRKVLRKWIEDNCQEEGWIVLAYLNSQGSVTKEGDGQRLQYSVCKYIEPPTAATADRG